MSRLREKRYAGRERSRPKKLRGYGCGGQTDREPTMGECELQECANTATAGSPSAASSAPDEPRPTMQSCGQSELHSRGQSRRELYCTHMELGRWLSSVSNRRPSDERSTSTLGQDSRFPGGYLEREDPSKSFNQNRDPLGSRTHRYPRE